MKRFRIYLLLVAFLCNAGFADEYTSAKNNDSTNFNNKFISGGFWSCGNERSGGFGELGFRLVDENLNHFVLRECITLGGYGSNLLKSGLDFGELQIGSKIIIGGMTNSNLFCIRSYGFAGIGFGIWGDKENSFASGSPLLELNFGGGFEFQYSQENAFVIEFGGRTEAPVGKIKNQFSPYTNSSPVLTIGYRSLVK